MVNVFFQLSFAVQTFLNTECIGTFFNFVYQILNFIQSASCVSLHCIVELLQTELHIVEVRDSFAQCTFRNIRQHVLEIAECLTSFVRQLRSNFFVALAVWNEQANTPIAIAIEIISFAIISRQESQYLTVDISFSFSLQFLANMLCNGSQVMLQHFYICKDMVVDALQNVFYFTFICCNFQCIVDMSVSERFSVNNFFC